MTVSADRLSPGSMTVVDGIDGLDRSLGRLFVVVGVFDGLHLGHAYLLRELERAARAGNARPAVITFDHHPDEILIGNAPPLLCDPDERLHLLEGSDVAVTVVQTFDVALRETPFDAFVRRITDRVDLAGFLMTPDSAFGYQRGGTPETVAALGRQLGYDVVVVPSFSLDGEAVSSSEVRAAIAAADFDRAARMLGRNYAVRGSSASLDGGNATRIETPLPVAAPPDGTYPAVVGVDDSSWNGFLEIDGAAVRVRPSIAVPDGKTVAAAPLRWTWETCRDCRRPSSDPCCVAKQHERDGRRAPTRPFGTGDAAQHLQPPPGCHDCGVPNGGYHHDGCDVERCPIDGEQVATDSCRITVVAA